MIDKIFPGILLFGTAVKTTTTDNDEGAMEWRWSTLAQVYNLVRHMLLHPLKEHTRKHVYFEK